MSYHKKIRMPNGQEDKIGNVIAEHFAAGRNGGKFTDLFPAWWKILKERNQHMGGRGAASGLGGEDMVRLRAYEKLSDLVESGKLVRRNREFHQK